MNSPPPRASCIRTGHGIRSEERGRPLRLHLHGAGFLARHDCDLDGRAVAVLLRGRLRDGLLVRVEEERRAAELEVVAWRDPVRAHALFSLAFIFRHKRI